MTKMTESRSRFILAMFALAFAAILLTSLFQRFTNPDLVISRFTPEATGSGSPTSGMSPIGALMEAAAKNPGDRQKLIQLVESLMAAGQWPAAENFAQRLLDLDKPGQETSRSMFLMAVIHHNLGRHAEAAEMFEKLLAKEDDPSARFSLAIIDLHFLDKSAEGIAQLQKALHNPNLSPAMSAAIKEELEAALKAHPVTNQASQTQTGAPAADSASSQKQESGQNDLPAKEDADKTD